MAVVNTLIGHIKGPKGDTGETGATGATGAAGADATVTVGSTTTVPYGQTARVTNTGTPGAAVFNFTIPQGKPGEQTTKLDALTLDALTEPSTSFPVPAVGDNGSTLFGKISKWFSDMAALVATKFNASNVVNNLTTTASGYALDARQGKTLSDKVDNKIYYKEYTTTDVSYSAGTPGSRGAQKVFDLDTGVTVVDVFVCFMADSARYIVIPFISASGTTGTRLYVNFYRADSSALGTADHARIRVVYMR